jgi:carboxymethylenebutenolidase
MKQPVSAMPLAERGHVPDELTFEAGTLALKGYLYLPPGPGPFACVINNHGSNLRPGSSDISRPQTAALMMAWGYAFFFPHRRGYGNSPGVPVAEAIPAALGSAGYDRQIVRRLDEECADVLAALDTVRAHACIDGDRIALSGSSRGGILSLLAAGGAKGAGAEGVRCAINFSGGARQWADHPGLRRKMLDAAAALTVPIFLAQAANDHDAAATLDLAEELARLDKSHDCRIYPPWGVGPREGHLFEVHGARIWGADVRRFLDRYMA